MEYTKGKIVEGKIIHVAEEYLLVKFPNKETGILHKSKISPQPEGDLTDLYRRNQSILVSIDWITEKGYTLGQKDIENRYENQLRHEANELEKMQRAEERERMKELVARCASRFERGGIYEAEVISLSNQVAKISIDGIDGYIKKDELNWNENDSVKESLFEGEIIHAVFLEYTDGKLLFGLKYLEEKPYDDELYSLSTEKLLKRLGHNNNVFVAEAKNIKGLCLTNLYSEEGNLLIDPFKGNNIVVRFIQPTIEEGKFYKVRVELLKEEKRRKSNDLFSFFASSAEEFINPYKSDVDLAFCKHTSPATNSSIANLLDEVGLNMYSSPERMFFELIQNADDAASENGVIINIDKLDNYLVFTHNGFHFSKNDFESLVSAAKSTKTSKEKTGYKGIGFKSVFTNSQQVYVHSGGYHFLFDKNTELYDDFDGFYFKVNKKNTIEEQGDFIRTFQSEKKSFRGVKDIPWQLLPIWYDDVPDSLKKSAFAKNQKVSFALNIKNQKIEDYVKAIEFLFDNPKFILFLRHTNRLDLKFANKTITKDVKNGIVTIKNSFASKRTEELIKRDFDDILVSNEAFDDKDIDIQIKEITNRQGEKENKFYDNNNQELEDIPDRIASSKTTTISFVANYDDGNITENNGNSLYAYLPMNEHRFRFPFYINADFVLAANRETLLDSPWNYYLLANIGELIVKWVAELANKGERNCLKLLPLQYFDDSTLDVEQLAQSFNSAYRTALESEAFILNQKGELAKQEDIIIDKTGLAEIVGADIFCHLLQTEKCLPSEKIDSKILEENIFEEIELIKFDDVIDAITNNSDFNNWYLSASDEQKNKLYKWIEDNNIKTRERKMKSFVSNLPLFQFGEDYKSCEEIDSSDHLITTKHISSIRDILSKLGFVCSDNIFEENHPLYEFIDLQNEKDLFDLIKKSDFSELTFDERKSLFFILADFDGVGDLKLKKEIALFKNMNGEFKSLNEMIAYREKVPVWLNAFGIAKEEYSPKLDNYLISDDQVFQEIVQAHYSDLECTSVLELYNQFKSQWTSTFTKTLIDKYGATDDLLTIVERTDGAKHYFIEKYGRINFEKETAKDSIEYRSVRLALSCDFDLNELKRLIFIDDKNITDFTIAPEVSITIDKEYLFPISEILTNQSEDYSVFNHTKNLLSDINGSDVLFSLTRMNSLDVWRQLKVLSTPTQYAFYVCCNIANNYRYTISITDEQFVTYVLDYFFDNEITVLGKYIQYFSNQKIIGRFINSDDYTLESERLSNVIRRWANNEEKEKFLISLGVKGNLSDEIKRRKAFINNESIALSYTNNISSEITSFLNWCITLKTPFTNENQVKNLKEMFSRLNIKTGYYKNDYQDIEEWNNERYTEFVKNRLPIYCIESEMPMRGVYKDVHLFTEYVGDYVCLIKPNRLYVNVKNKNIETVLLSVCDDKYIPFTKDDWTKLFMVSVETLNEKENEIVVQKEKIKTLSEENQKKNEIIEQYRAKYGELLVENGNTTKEEAQNIVTNDILNVMHSNSQDEIYRQSGKVIERDRLSLEEQINAHKEAEQVVRETLENDGYDCSNWILNEDSNDTFKKWHSVNQVDNIISPDGESINLVIKSAKGGYIYLSATDFEFLTTNSNNVLIVWDGKNVHSVTAKDIFNKDSNVNLIFDTEYTPKHYFAALSKVFQYIKRTTFAVKNPSYNPYDTIKSFGMDSKTEGIQELFDDNDL